MAREKGMGCLQREKSGRWTMRVCIHGKRYSRSTRTKDRDQAERVLQRFLAPLGLGERRLPLADVWLEYVKSPNRNELAKATLDAKRIVWMHFAKWMERSYLHVDTLGEVTSEMVAEYLACLRADLCGSTYNGRVCVLREIFRTLADKAGLEEDPWAGVRLRPDDSHSRRELTMDELRRLLEAAKKRGGMKEVERRGGQRKASSVLRPAGTPSPTDAQTVEEASRLLGMEGDSSAQTVEEASRLLGMEGDSSAQTVEEASRLLGMEGDSSILTRRDASSTVCAAILTRRDASSTGGSDHHSSTSTLNSNSTSEWHTLFLIGIYTGLRLGDCCRLAWSNINLGQGVIQVIPQKTKRHAHGRPVTIPIHPTLGAALVDVVEAKARGEGEERMSPSGSNATGMSRPLCEGPVLPMICEMYERSRCKVSDELAKIFKAANITMSVKIDGRKHKTPEATFHSLRHTFVSFAANAGIPLHFVQSIVGHESTAMTRHYYHEDVAGLRRAVAAIPAFGTVEEASRLLGMEDDSSILTRRDASSTVCAAILTRRDASSTCVGDRPFPRSVAARLKELEALKAAKAISGLEYKATRARILAEL